MINCWQDYSEDGHQSLALSRKAPGQWPGALLSVLGHHASVTLQVTRATDNCESGEESHKGALRNSLCYSLARHGSTHVCQRVGLAHCGLRSAVALAKPGRAAVRRRSTRSARGQKARLARHQTRSAVRGGAEYLDERVAVSHAAPDPV